MNTNKHNMTRICASLTKRICDHLREGGKRASICAEVGISINTWNKWLRDGREILERAGGNRDDALKMIREADIDDKEKDWMRKRLDFACFTTKAWGERNLVLEKRVHAAAVEDARLALEVLSRTQPKVWGKQVAPPVVIQPNPIKQIVIHANEQKMLEEKNAIEAEFENVE